MFSFLGFLQFAVFFFSVRYSFVFFCVSLGVLFQSARLSGFFILLCFLLPSIACVLFVVCVVLLSLNNTILAHKLTPLPIHPLNHILNLKGKLGNTTNCEIHYPAARVRISR